MKPTSLPDYVRYRLRGSDATLDQEGVFCLFKSIADGRLDDKSISSALQAFEVTHGGPFKLVELIDWIFDTNVDSCAKQAPCEQDLVKHFSRQ